MLDGFGVWGQGGEHCSCSGAGPPGLKGDTWSKAKIALCPQFQQVLAD